MNPIKSRAYPFSKLPHLPHLGGLYWGGFVPSLALRRSHHDLGDLDFFSSIHPKGGYKREKVPLGEEGYPFLYIIGGGEK